MDKQDPMLYIDAMNEIQNTRNELINVNQSKPTILLGPKGPKGSRGAQGPKGNPGPVGPPIATYFLVNKINNLNGNGLIRFNKAKTFMNSEAIKNDNELLIVENGLYEIIIAAYSDDKESKLTFELNGTELNSHGHFFHTNLIYLMADEKINIKYDLTAPCNIFIIIKKYSI